MKKFIITSVLLAMFGSCLALQAQNTQEEYLGLPGDNLNLYAVMKLFQESETLEGFERNLNDQNSQINNLDLNSDNYVDYIKVLDYIDGNVHTIVLQVAVNSRENQDVAVFTVQRFANNQVQIQLVGDEALYGKNYIIEPIFDNGTQGETPNPGYLGNNVLVRTTTYEIANWPLVRYIYMPTYVVWRSGWYWNYYPTYWHPWRPHYWHYYYGYHSRWYGHYYSHYRRWNNYRYTRWNDFYYIGKRSYSPVVNINIHAGNYKATYSRPSQRRKGEALYTKLNSGPYNRSGNNTAGNSTTRRSGSQAAPVRQNTVSTRRAPATVTNKSVTNPQPGQRAASTQTTRRQTTAAANRSVTNSQPAQRATSTQQTRRPTTTVTNKSVTKSQPAQRATSTQPTRRPTTAVSNRSATNSQPVKRAATQSSRKPAITGVSSSSRRSSGSSKPVAAPKNEVKKKVSEPSKTTRRR